MNQVPNLPVADFSLPENLMFIFTETSTNYVKVQVSVLGHYFNVATVLFEVRKVDIFEEISFHFFVELSNQQAYVSPIDWSLTLSTFTVQVVWPEIKCFHFLKFKFRRDFGKKLARTSFFAI